MVNGELRILNDQWSTINGQLAISGEGGRGEVRGQKSEVRGQKSEDGGQKSEVRGQRIEVSGRDLQIQATRRQS